jgi:hypothetical protein
MRRLPRIYPTTPLLHFGNASLEQSSIMENGVARCRLSTQKNCLCFFASLDPVWLPIPAFSFGIAAEHGGQGALLLRASTRYASFGSQTYAIDIFAL